MKGIIFITAAVQEDTLIKGKNIVKDLCFLEHPIILSGNSFIQSSGYHTSNVISIQMMNDLMEEESEDSVARCGSII